MVNRDIYPLLPYTIVKEVDANQLALPRVTELVNRVPILLPAEVLTVRHFQLRYFAFVERRGLLSVSEVRLSRAIVRGVEAHVRA